MRTLVRSLLVILVIVVAITAIPVSQPARAAITQACPANWVRVLTGRGVLVCGKKDAAGNFNTYVQWVDLSRGARVRQAFQLDAGSGSATNPSPKFRLRTVDDWNLWLLLNPQQAGDLFSVVNGAFFKLDEALLTGRTQLSYPFKSRGSLITAGADNPDWTGRVLSLPYSQTSASMRDYNLLNNSWSTTQSNLINDHEAIVGLHPTRISVKPTERIPRTWVGLRDADGNGQFESVYFLTTKAATQSEALNMLAQEFFTSWNAQFDGSDSTQFVLRGTPYISASRRVPHAFAIYEAIN